MTRAIVTRRFSHEGQSFAAHDVLDLSEGQFADWEAAGLVTADELTVLHENNSALQEQICAAEDVASAAGDDAKAAQALVDAETPTPRAARKGK